MGVPLLVLAVCGAALQVMSAGIHVLGVAALNPSWRDLAPATYVEVKQAADRRFPLLMRPFTLAGLAAVGLLAVLAGVSGAVAVAAWAAVALVAALVGLVAVLRGDLPVNRRMATWSPADPPADWQHERARWEQWFRVRTAAALVAAGASLAALVVVSARG